MGESTDRPSTHPSQGWMATAAAAYVHPLTGDVRWIASGLALALDCTLDDTVSFVGPRAEMRRFFAEDLLPHTDKPVVVSVHRTHLAEVFTEAGYAQLATIYAALHEPATDGALRVLACLSTGIALVRVWKGAGP